MHKRAVFLIAVIVCSNLVFLVEGRLIKSVTKNGSKQISTTEDDQAGAPSYIPNAAHYSVAGKKEILPPPTPTKTSDFGDSVTGYTDDFRPTTPGNSPGVGHSFAEGDEDVEQKPGSISSSNGKLSIAGDKDDFRPTNPGHSPGVGHAFLSKNSEPKD
ncbi:hypothetical protein PTKIN_Ptkin08bG0105000 [Pterospermum kingtungense]